jgi:hypothetical protein
MSRSADEQALGRSTVDAVAGPEPPSESLTRNKIPLGKRLWFRATCALVPVIAIVLIVSTVNQASPRPLAPSSSVAHSSSDTSAGSVAAGNAAAGTRNAGGNAAAGTSTASASGGSPVSTGANGTAAGSGSGPSAGNPSGSAAGSPWAAAHAQLLADLRTDATNLDADVANQELPSLSGDCVRLREDLQTAQGVPQVPSTSDNALWSQALGDFSQAIAQCPNGPDDRDLSKVSEAAQASSSAETTLTTMLSQIGGKSG